MQIRASLSPRRNRIFLRFPYNPVVVRQVKQVPGASWVPSQKVWSFPLELRVAEELRLNLGDRLVVDDELREWGIAERLRQLRLSELAMADDAEVFWLRKCNPELGEYLRPYQRADVARMAASSCVNANQPGLGKTVEVVAATLEAGLPGRHLVVCPVISIDLVWIPEITRWLPNDTIHTGASPLARNGAVIDAAEDGGSCWCVVNPETLRADALEAAASVQWDSVTIDEFDRFGLSNPNTNFSKLMRTIEAKRMWPLSGTPLGGKAINFWSILNLMYPKEFSSRWRWAEQWLQVVNNGFGKNIGELKPMMESKFFDHHAPWVIRRLKSEVLPDLPPKQYKHVVCRMTKKQAAQYEKFELDAEVIIGEKRVVGTSILAEYTRLRQMAFSMYDRVGDKLVPTDESGKLDALMQNLKHHGIDRKGGEWSVVASQYTKVCKFLHKWLNDKGIKADIIVGETPKDERTRIVREFQSGKGARVIVINTKAAGVSITLDKAESMHVMDKTWNPDNQEQLEDRIHRGNTTHKVMIYTYTSEGTIEEAIDELNLEKSINSKNILDVHRKLRKAARDHGGPERS